MPYTLAEHLPGMTEPIARGAYIWLLRESVIADMLSFRNTRSLQITGERFDNVISPEWIDLNEPIPEKSTRGKNLSFGVYQMAVHLDIPNPLEADQGVLERPAARQAKMTMIGSAYEFNDVFINGDQGVNPKQFEGIEKIATNLGDDQNIGSTEIDITGNPAENTMFEAFERIDQGIDAVNGHEPDFALVSRRAGARLRDISRRLGLAGDHFNWIEGLQFKDVRKNGSMASTKPMFVYNSVPFYDIGPKADQTTGIISDSNAEAGSAGATRIYFVKQGSDNLEGLQFAPPSLKKIADTLESKDVQRHRFNWITGLGMWSGNGISVVRGLKVA